jgi:hypothetical protein
VSYPGRLGFSAWGFATWGFGCFLCVLGVLAGSLAVCPDLYHPFPTSECRYRRR